MSYYQPPSSKHDLMFWLFIGVCILSSVMGWTVETPA